MSEPPLRAVTVLQGYGRTPALVADTDGSLFGEFVLPRQDLAGEYDVVANSVLFSPNAVANVSGGYFPVRLIDAIDMGCGFLQVDVLDFDSGAIGPYESGINPMRRYGSVGFWSGESFVGHAAITRTQNRFNLSTESFTSGPMVDKACRNDYGYVYNDPESLERFVTMARDYLSGGPAGRHAVTKITYSLTPSVRIRLQSYSLYAGIYRMYTPF